ncbi:hypothetical protein L798_13423 [Zootermopsis nevadensis]|uniref:Shavenoid isoform B-like N-terminal domain-containing protein n=1 Tax=Zootermopsis nevadensis TaxID=136037 RepID=A0A067QYQ2_ZOONE|nr:hypothetical protein L798_13423 [Zootermopsis nevadensis]
MRPAGCAVPMRGVLILQWLLLWRLSQADHPIVTISRQYKGDMFTAEGLSCSKEVCAGSSSGTAGVAEKKDCACQCLPHLPVFRDDLHICIDDIHGKTLQFSFELFGTNDSERIS